MKDRRTKANPIHPATQGCKILLKASSTDKLIAWPWSTRHKMSSVVWFCFKQISIKGRISVSCPFLGKWMQWNVNLKISLPLTGSPSTILLHTGDQFHNNCSMCDCRANGTVICKTCPDTELLRAGCYVKFDVENQFPECCPVVFCKGDDNYSVAEYVKYLEIKLKGNVIG